MILQGDDFFHKISINFPINLAGGVCKLTAAASNSGVNSANGVLYSVHLPSTESEELDTIVVLLEKLQC